MIRKLVLPALAALLLAGCATYQYRGGASGDYYHGQPGTDYRYYGYPSLGGYGYGPGFYGSTYWSRSYYGYGRPYYRPPYRPPHHHGPRPGNDHGQNPQPQPHPGNNQQDRPQAPWRDLERLRNRDRALEGTRRPASETGRGPARPEQQAPPRQQPQPQQLQQPRQQPRPQQSSPSQGRTHQKRDRHRIMEL